MSLDRIHSHTQSQTFAHFRLSGSRYPLIWEKIVMRNTETKVEPRYFLVGAGQNEKRTWWVADEESGCARVSDKTKDIREARRWLAALLGKDS